MKRKTNRAKEEAWSQTAHAPDGEQPGPEASDTSGQSVPKSKFRKKSQQERAAAAKLHMESQGEKLEQAREKLAKQKPPKKPGPVKRIGRVASGSVHSFVHGKIFEVEQENVGTEGAHRSELVGETALRHGSRFVRRKVREHPAKVVRKAEARYTKYTADYHFHTAAQEHPELTKNALTRYWQKQRLRRQYRKQAKEAAKQSAAAAGKTATATERLTARAVEFVKSHPAGAVIAVLCVLLLFAMQSCSSMATLGNRPDLFPDSPYVNKYITGKPGDYEVPGEYLDDETFAAMLAEAQKYIGYPYVWGGSSPATSFDCSGYVSWVINHSGWNVGRLGAQGLYNICTPTSSPKPGDLVFFKGTYDTPGVSHCGIYVGDGKMLHCGDPIGYANLNTSYWQSHFYAYGRLP